MSMGFQTDASRVCRLCSLFSRHRTDIDRSWEGRALRVHFGVLCCAIGSSRTEEFNQSVCAAVRDWRRSHSGVAQLVGTDLRDCGQWHSGVASIVGAAVVGTRPKELHHLLGPQKCGAHLKT